MRIISFLIICLIFTQCSSNRVNQSIDIITYHFNNHVQTIDSDKNTTRYYYSSNKVIPNKEMIRIMKEHLVYTKKNGNYEGKILSKFYSKELENQLSTDSSYDIYGEWNSEEIKLLKEGNIKVLIDSTEFYGEAFKKLTYNNINVDENYYLAVYSRPVKIEKEVFAFQVIVFDTFGMINNPHVLVYRKIGNSFELLEKIEDTNLY